MLTDNELVAIIRANRRDSLGYEDGALSSERAAAFDHYHGDPYGNEREGRSAVVSKDLAEAIDRVLPDLLEIFLASGNVAEFTPVGPEDEELAEQETEYVNHVIMEDNNGYLVLHDWFKDALLLKNGYVKYYWDDSEKITESEYDGISEIELAMMLQRMQSYDTEVEIVEYDERLEFSPEVQQEIPVYDVKIRCKKKVNRVRLEVVPPEEIRVAKRTRGGCKSSPFIEHVTRKLRSDLIEMGMDEDFVNSLPAFTEDDNDSEEYSRNSVDDEYERDANNFDRSVDEIEYCEAYLKVDYDGDGIAELRKVVTVADRIPPGDDWNEQIDSVPLASIVPKRVPHRHVGESLDDEIADIQEIKTVLIRQLLDNVYRTNNSEYLVNERAHLPDFMKSLPGGVKRITGDEPVNGSVMAIQSTPVLNQILPAIDYMDTVKSGRTGLTGIDTHTDPNVLRETTKGAYLESVKQSNKKVQMYARMFAETGVRELVLGIHELLIKHQDTPRMIKMRGKDVNIDPQQWKERTDLRVTVGIGTGTDEEKREKLILLAGLQEKVAQIGLVGPKQAYTMFADIAKTLGFNMPEKYVLDPESEEYMMFIQQQQQGEQSNPLAEAEQVKGMMNLQIQQVKQEFEGQAKMVKMESDMRLKAMEEQYRGQLEMVKEQMKMANNDADRKSKEAIEIAKLELQAMIEGFRVDLGQPGIGAELSEQ